MELQEQPESESALAHPASQEAPETSESRPDEVMRPSGKMPRSRGRVYDGYIIKCIRIGIYKCFIVLLWFFSFYIWNLFLGKYLNYLYIYIYILVYKKKSIQASLLEQAFLSHLSLSLCSCYYIVRGWGWLTVCEIRYSLQLTGQVLCVWDEERCVSKEELDVFLKDASLCRYSIQYICGRTQVSVECLFRPFITIK